jgi:hypothetical protein
VRTASVNGSCRTAVDIAARSPPDFLHLGTW